MQLCVQLVHDHKATPLKSSKNETRQPHELLRSSRLLGQAKLIPMSANGVSHVYFLPALFFKTLNPKAVDRCVNALRKRVIAGESLSSRMFSSARSRYELL